MKISQFIPAAIILLIFFSGCINKIEERDRLNSTMEFDLSDYIQNLQRPFGTEEPCTCMICTKEEESAWYNIFGISSDKTDSALVDSKCDFVQCNATTYEETIGNFDDKKGDWSLCEYAGKDKICAPRFFMFGSGISSAEFSLGQKFCAGDLTMPVIWTTPQKDKPPKTPDPQTLMCHLSKSQMPIVVWYSNGKYINHASYSTMLKSFNNATNDPVISGPIMVTTEALADPYLPLDQTNGKKKLNISLLNQIKSQIETIKRDCPNCISVLALKPTLNETEMPDMCPLDYFFAYRPLEHSLAAEPDPMNCENKYAPGAYASRPAMSGFGTKIDLIGVGFNANENENLTTCTPLKSIAQHLIYSKKALNNFYVPSVWYSVAMSEGPTSTPSCTFSQQDISKAYYDLMQGVSGYVASGVIGISPYKLIDSPLTGPLECKNQVQLPLPSISSLDEISAGAQITLEGGMQIDVARTLQKGEKLAIFEDSKARTYIAYTESSVVHINRSGCQYGLITMDGRTKNNSQFSWFSSCQFYYNDRGPLFKTELKSLDQVYAGDYIYSDDGLYRLFVEAINTSTKEEKVFFASNGQIVRRFSAKMDGDYAMIYDMPRTPKAQQALMFSSNGVGSQCTAFEAGKMFFRSSISQTRPEGAPPVPVPQDEKMLEEISASQCGNCLSFAPMPQYFCEANQYLVDNRELFKSKGWGVNLNFPEEACTQYPEMDTKFLEYSLDPVLMRAIGVGESGLGNGIDYGNSAPACAMSSASKDNSNCGSNKKPSDLAKYESNYCSSGLLRSKAQAIEDAKKRVCALGVFQCIKSPSSDYNPFEPIDSADCGSYEFKDKGGRYVDTLASLRSLKSSNPNIPLFNPDQGGMSGSELEWYAAWIASYHYSGMGVASISLLQSYVPKDKKDNIVAFMHRELETYCINNPDEICYPHYGTAFIIRYNEGLKVCNSGCIPKYCS